eukprot:6468887-Amphidinium_carterae.1
MDIARAYMGQHYGTLCQYEWSPPLMFAGALHEEFRKAVLLPRMKEIWSTLEELETTCGEGSFPRKFALELLWPRNVIIREIFVAAWEMDFEDLPAEYITRIKGLFCNFGGSRIVELAFNHLTDVFKRTSSSNLKRLHRWSSLATSTLLEEHGHVQLKPTEDKQLVAAAELAEQKFALSELEFTLGADAAKSIEQDISFKVVVLTTLSQEKDRETFSIAATQSMGMATKFLVSCRENFETLANHYWNLLAVPGTVLYRSATMDGANASAKKYYVVHATQYGVVTLLLSLKKQKGKHFLEYVTESGIQHEVLYIKQLGGWNCQALEVNPPMDSTDNGSIMLTNGKPLTLLRYAAMQGFPQLSLPHLRSLLEVLDVPLPNGRPTLLQDVLELLVLHLHPGMGKEAVDKILASRVRSKPAYCEALLPSNASVLMTGLDVHETAELLREVEDIQKKQASRAKQSNTSKKRRKAVPLKKEYGITTEELREFLPQHIAGCSIMVEENWHHRVRGFYPRQVPPYSMSLSFGDIRSTKVAALGVLKWIWEQHTANTGAECPWTFE